MIVFLWIILALVIGLFHMLRGHKNRTTGENAAILLKWWLGIAVGVSSIVGALFHIFDGKEIAEQICFTRGDGGFQFENAMGDLAIGVAALACIWVKKPAFWAAVILMMTIQYLGDAYGHFYQMIENDNHCVDNTGPVLWSDIILPVVSVGLFSVMHFWKKDDSNQQEE
jgi:hypothetical protein